MGVTENSKHIGCYAESGTSGGACIAAIFGVFLRANAPAGLTWILFDLNDDCFLIHYPLRNYTDEAKIQSKVSIVTVNHYDGYNCPFHYNCFG